MTSARALNRAITTYQRWLAIKGKAQDDAARRLSAMLNRYYADLARILATEANGHGPAIIAQKQIDGIIRSMTEEGNRVLAQNAELQKAVGKQAFSIEGGASMETYAVFGRASAEAIQQAQQQFAPAARAMIAGGPESGFATWTSTVTEQVAGGIQSMREAMIFSKVHGLNSKGLAERMLQDPRFNFDNLPPVTDKGMAIFTRGGKLGEADALKNRAHMIARTETNAVQNRMHIGWTQAAGFELYINVNPMDDRTSIGCAEATLEKAKTEAEWNAWTGSDGQSGVPPRLPNCRSSLMAVPSDAASETGKPPDAKVEFTTGPQGGKHVHITEPDVQDKGLNNR